MDISSVVRSWHCRSRGAYLGRLHGGDAIYLGHFICGSERAPEGQGHLVREDSIMEAPYLGHSTCGLGRALEQPCLPRKGSKTEMPQSGHSTTAALSGLLSPSPKSIILKRLLLGQSKIGMLPYCYLYKLFRGFGRFMFLLCYLLCFFYVNYPLDHNIFKSLDDNITCVYSDGVHIL